MIHRSIYRLVAFLVGLLVGHFAITENPPASPRAILETKASTRTSVSPSMPFSLPNQTTSKSVSSLRPKVCNDPKIRPIWNAIRWNEEVREALDDETSPSNCRDIFEIRYVDLNRDGKTEILARIVSVPFCGAVGNCDLFILKRTKKGLRLILHANDYIDATEMGEQVLKARTNGYLDILTKGHFSVSETSHTTYKYNGRRYVESICKYEVPKYDRDGKLGWEFISCKEFSRRLDRELDQLVNLR